MDPSQSNSSGAGAQLQHDAGNNNFGNFLGGGMDSFAGASDQFAAGDGDLKDFFHPDLFDGDMGSNNPQQSQQQPSQQSPSQNFNSALYQHGARQSQSPALPAFTPSQQPFQQQHSQFSTNLFEPHMYQHQQGPYDPRFFQQRPTHSPSPLDQYQYPQHQAFSQNYHQQPMQIPPRDSNTPTQSVDPRRQGFNPFLTFDSRSPQMYSHQMNGMMQHQTFPDQSQRPGHFVDPNLLNSNQLAAMNGNYASIAQRPVQHSAFFSKTGSTIDPRSLQEQQASHLQQHPAAGPQPSTGVNIPHVAPKTRVPKDPNGPKRPRGRPRKDGTTAKQGGQGSASVTESDSELEIEDDQPPEMTPAVLSVMMPTDERGKALYNAVKAVWTPRNKTAPVEKVKSGIALFGETVKALRDAWKAKNENLKKAELPNAPTAPIIPQLKADVAHYRQVMESVIGRSLQFGHPAILRRLGDNQWALSAMYAFMLDRVTVGDYDSPLINNILKLAAYFETVDEELLETVKWPKLLQRLTKKATNDSKALAQRVIDNAAAASAKKKNSGPGSPGPNGELAAGVKRSREGEVVGQSVAKKPLVKPSSKPLALQNAERRRAAEAAKKSEKASDTTANDSATTSAAAKIKPATAPPVKSTSFASLMSASKRPGTTNAERAAAAKEKASAISAALANVKKESVKQESPPRTTAPSPASKPQSTFLGFLSDLEKKEDVKPKQEDIVMDETPEQKAKRERKESRRKLRVSWKADAELVETREFVHDPEEELGHEDSMMKDAGDTMKEGEMLKLHKGMDDLEDDEGEDEPAFDSDEYSPPSVIDFNEMDGVQYNFTKTGGPLKPESTSREAQEKLEANSVMVVYASQSDRPTTPKDPPEEDDADFQPCANFGEPDDRTRIREKEFLARQKPSFDLAAQLQTMNPGNAPNQASQPAPFNLQQAVGMMNQSQQNNASQLPVDFQKLAAAVQHVKQRLETQPQQQPQPQAAGPTAQPAVNSDLSALLAQLQQQHQQSLQALPTGAGSNPNPFPGNDESRKHGLDDSSGGKAKKKKGNKPGADTLPYNYKTQTCSFWLEGKCTKGDACTYRHDEA